MSLKKFVHKSYLGLVNSNRFVAYFVLGTVELYLKLVWRIYCRNKFNQTLNFNCNLAVGQEIELVTVAFNNEYVIEKQILLLKKFLTDNYHLTIADNSNKPDKQDLIFELCKKHNVGYVRLPKNPWKQPNLSHSCALNWLYYNYIKHSDIKNFGFLDHDIFPYKTTSILEKLEGKNMYGKIQDREVGGAEVWYLWAGFCFFNAGYLKNKNVNFSSVVYYDLNSWVGLDTGGGNWHGIYSNANKSEASLLLDKVVVLSEKDNELFREPNSDSEPTSDILDDWLHLRAVSFKQSIDSDVVISKIFTKLLDNNNE